MQQVAALVPIPNYRPGPPHRPQRLPQYAQSGAFSGPRGPPAYVPEQLQPANVPFGTGMQYSDMQQAVQPRVYSPQGMAMQYPDGQGVYNQQGGLQQPAETQWYDQQQWQQQQQQQQQRQQSSGQGAYSQQGFKAATQANSLSAPLASQLQASSSGRLFVLGLRCQ